MKTLLKVAKIICYLCSFPLFMICAIVASKTNIEMGSSYGLLTYASVIVPVLFAVIWAIIVLVQELKIKKNTVNKATKIKKQTTKQVIASLLLCAGLMFILDGVLPSIFPDLTSGTIFYEDLAESDAANERAELNKEMLDVIIARSVLNGTIGDYDGDGYTQYYTKYKTSDIYGPYTGYNININGSVITPVVMGKYGYYVTVDSYNPETGEGTHMDPTARSETEIAEMNKYFERIITKYQTEAMKNEEVQSLLNRDGEKNLYGSLNLSGYESWVGPWVDLANAGRMTIPIVLNLIIGQRPTIVTSEDSFASPKSYEDGTRYTQSALQTYPYYNQATGKVENIQISWTVLDMMGDYTTDLYNPAPALAIDLSSTFGEEGLWAMLSNLNLLGLPLGTVIEGLLYDGGEIIGLQIPSLYYIVDTLLNSVSYAVANPVVAGTPTFTSEDDTTNAGWKYGFAPLGLRLANADGTTGIYAKVDGNVVYCNNLGNAPTQLGIYAANYERGTIDYMRYSWVDSNGLIFAITGLFAIRKTCYVFSGITVLMAIIVGAIRIKLLNMDQNAKRTKTAKKSKKAEASTEITSPIEETIPNQAESQQYAEPQQYEENYYYGNV